MNRWNKAKRRVQPDLSVCCTQSLHHRELFYQSISMSALLSQTGRKSETWAWKIRFQYIFLINAHGSNNNLIFSPLFFLAFFLILRAICLGTACSLHFENHRLIKFSGFCIILAIGWFKCLDTSFLPSGNIYICRLLQSISHQPGPCSQREQEMCRAEEEVWKTQEDMGV